MSPYREAPPSAVEEEVSARAPRWPLAIAGTIVIAAFAFFVWVLWSALQIAGLAIFAVLALWMGAMMMWQSGRGRMMRRLRVEAAADEMVSPRKSTSSYEALDDLPRSIRDIRSAR